MTGKSLTGTASAVEEAPGAPAAECPRQSVKTERFSEPEPGVPLLGKFACWSIFFFSFCFESRWRNHFTMTLLKKKKVRQDLILRCMFSSQFVPVTPTDSGGSYADACRRK